MVRTQQEESSFPVISVRSEVERSVDPDQLTLHGHLGVLRDDKSAALQAAAVAVETLKSGLSKLGGVTLSASTARNPLTWSIQQVQTHPYHDPSTGRTGTTIAAAASVLLTIRNMGLVEAVEELLASMDGLQMGHAQWHVDPENPAWAELRGEAIREALRKGKDYAEALGAQLVEVQHIADVGLLGSDAGARVASASFRAASGGPGSSPSLDPVPQLLVARIEARFRTTPIPLDQG
jgi:uncharacterized protein